MLQVDKSVNFMLNIQNSIYRESSNVILSPFSLEILSFSILTGVTGPSFDELCNILFGNNLTPEGVVQAIKSFKVVINHIKTMPNIDFRLHNFIYVSDKFEIIQNFIDFVYNNLDTRVKQINFDDENLELNKIIDQDIREATCGKVNQVIKFFPTASKLLLVNCIAFQGELKYKPIKTYDDKFKPDISDEIDVPYTVQRNKYKLIQDNVHDFVYVEMPYKNEKMNLCLILPNPGTTVREILGRLDYEMLMQLYRTANSTQVEVHMPIVKLQSNIDLAYVMQISGVCKVFEEQNANFTKFVSNPRGLFLESFITNSELNMQDLSKIPINKTNKPQAPASVPTIIFNRPFIYFINCDMKKQPTIILFSGVVNIIES